MNYNYKFRLSENTIFWLALAGLIAMLFMTAILTHKDLPLDEKTVKACGETCRPKSVQSVSGDECHCSTW